MVFCLVAQVLLLECICKSTERLLLFGAFTLLQQGLYGSKLYIETCFIYVFIEFTLLGIHSHTLVVLKGYTSTFAFCSVFEIYRML